MNWKIFLDSIFLGDREIMDTMQRLVGYASTGDKTAGIIVVCHGEGRNGRTTFFKALQLAMGEELAFGCPGAGEFMERDHSLPSPAMFRFRGVKLAVFPEVSETKRRKLSCASLKHFASDEDITAREPFARAPETFRNAATPFFDTSGLTFHQAVQMDKALADRCVFMPFPARLVSGRIEARTWRTAIRSDVVMECLGRDVDAIREWIDAGAHLYNTDGLVIPERFRASSQTARRVA